MGLPPLWSLPSPLRPPHGSFFAGLAFFVTFNSCILLTWASLVLLYPLTLFASTRSWYFSTTKRSFGCGCVEISQLFAPTSFIVSGGQGVDAERWVERDSKGKVQGLKLAERGVWVSACSLGAGRPAGEGRVSARAQAAAGELQRPAQLTKHSAQISNHQTLCDWL